MTVKDEKREKSLWTIMKEFRASLKPYSIPVLRQMIAERVERRDTADDLFDRARELDPGALYQDREIRFGILADCMQAMITEDREINWIRAEIVERQGR